METFERRSEEETYLWFPFQFLVQTLKAILKCFGFLHHDSPASSPVTLSEPEEEVEASTKYDVVVTTRGSRNGVALQSRGIKVKAKKKGKERVSTGQPGQHN